MTRVAVVTRVAAILFNAGLRRCIGLLGMRNICHNPALYRDHHDDAKREPQTPVDI